MKRTRNVLLVLVIAALGGCVWVPDGGREGGRYGEGGYRGDERGEHHRDREERRERGDEEGRGGYYPRGY